MKNLSLLLFSAMALFLGHSYQGLAQQDKPVGTLEIVAELDVTPGNAAVSREGRVFATVHPLRPRNVQLIEITGKTAYVAFPNKVAQSQVDLKSEDKLDTPLGIVFDSKNRLWVLDVGLNIGKTRLFAYDIDTRKEILHFDIPQELAPEDSFVQDLAVDDDNGFVYLADVRNPGIIVVNINDGTFRKIIDLPSMQAEDADMIIDGNVQKFEGEPARIAIDPITISADNETLYYGSMNGTKWYQLPTRGIRNGDPESKLIKQISIVAEKPFSDGVETDENGNHYITNIQDYSIDVLTNNGELRTIKKDPLLDWPDSVRIHGDWLYIAASQVHKTAAFAGGKDIGTMPFRILRVKY
ncbi:MAG: L-dopachrome tautomerase-related protein, partial [Bacteroidota bacterium]